MKFFILVVFAITGTLATDYCAPDLCQFYTGTGFETRPHIACPGVAVNNCPADAVPITIDAATQAVILAEHNKIRNNLAGGKVKSFATAAAMPEMTWCTELADIAAKNVMQCLFDHDQCRNTEKYLYAGQNIGSLYGGIYKDSKKCAAKMVDKWYQEFDNPALTQGLLDNYQKSSLRVGHFAQIMSDRSNKVGCAGVNYDTNYHFFVCNYGFTIMIGEPVYKKGAVGSGCKSGRSTKYPNLCSADEVVRSMPLVSRRTLIAPFDEE